MKQRFPTTSPRWSPMWIPPLAALFMAYQVIPHLICGVSAMATTLLCAERPFLRTMARIQHATFEKAFKVYQDFVGISQYHTWYNLVHQVR